MTELSKSDVEDKEDDGDDLGEEIMALVGYYGTNMETNHLPQFCSHKEKILLSSNWANGTKHVGRGLRDVAEFRNVLC